MTQPKYQVNDEDGPLRVFHSKKEATDFAKEEGYYVIVLGGKPKDLPIDWDNYEPAPF